MSRSARTLLALVAACSVAVGVAVVVPSAADAAASHGTSKHKPKKHKHKKPKKPPKPVTIAPGTKVKYYNVKISKKRVVRSALLRLDMTNRHVRLDATLPGGAVGAGRQTITTQTRARRAIGGLNADFFDIRSGTGAPNGGVVVGGVMMKSPRANWDANFYVRGGRARIGALAFSGSVTRYERPAPDPDPSPLPPLPVLNPPAAPAPATTRVLYSVNSVKDLAKDRLVLVTSALAAPRFGRACNVASAVPTATPGRYVVTATYANVTSAPRVTGRGVAVVSCGTGARASWLNQKIIAGDTLGVATAIAGGMPSTLVSGGQVLVRNGRGFADTDGKTITGRNPETFGCVSQSGRKVLLGTIDGRREGSSGVTLPELRRYLLKLHCWNGIVFDGGGSSTLVGRPAGRSSVRVLNRPSDRGGARRVTSGLVVYAR